MTLPDSTLSAGAFASGPVASLVAPFDSSVPVVPVVPAAPAAVVSAALGGACFRHPVTVMRFSEPEVAGWVCGAEVVWPIAAVANATIAVQTPVQIVFVMQPPSELVCNRPAAAKTARHLFARLKPRATCTKASAERDDHRVGGSASTSARSTALPARL